MRKKWLALVLSCAMVMNTCAIPVAASAVDSVSSVVSETEEAVEQSGDIQQDVEPEQDAETEQDTAAEPEQTVTEDTQDVQVENQTSGGESSDKKEAVEQDAEASDSDQKATEKTIRVTSNFDKIADAGDTLPEGYDDPSKGYGKLIWQSMPGQLAFEEPLNLEYATYGYADVAQRIPNSKKYKLKSVSLTVGEKTLRHEITVDIADIKKPDKDPFTDPNLFDAFGSDNYEVRMADSSEGDLDNYFGGGCISFYGILKANAEIYLEFEKVASDSDQKATEKTIRVTSNFDKIADAGDTLPEGYDDPSKGYGKLIWQSMPGQLAFEEPLNLEYATYGYADVAQRIPNSKKYKLKSVSLTVGEKTLRHEITVDIADIKKPDKDPFTDPNLFDAFGSDNYEVRMADSSEGDLDNYFGGGCISFYGILKANAEIYLEFEKVKSDIEPEEPEEGMLLKGFESSYGNVDFDDKKEATVYVPTDTNSIGIKVISASGKADTGIKLHFSYTSPAGTEASSDATVNGYNTWINNCIGYNGQGNDIQITATKGEVSQTYTLHVLREAQIRALTLQDKNGKEISFTPAFDRAKTAYSAVVLEDVDKVILQAADALKIYNEKAAGVQFNGVRSENGTCEVALQSGENKITFKADNGAARSTEYTLTVNKIHSVALQFTVKPANAQVCLYDKAGERVQPVNGVYALYPDTEYTYTAACEGYVGQNGTVSVTAEEQSATKEITLDQAPESAELPQLKPEYGGFRADSDNQSVIDAKTPTTKENIEVKWERQVGTGVNATSGSTPVIVGKKIYTQSAGKLYMMDKETGEVIKSSDCVTTNAGFNLIPVTYGDGMIFVPLGGGYLQCFNADTLESLWVYKNPKGGDCNSPIRYDDGKIYVGFQNNTGKNYFVCLTTTDEDPSNATEEKVTMWTNYDGELGYQWAGAWSNAKYVFSVNLSGALMVMDKNTGETVQKIQAVKADIGKGPRSSIAYYNNRIYFTTQSGYLCSYNLDADGKVDLDKPIEPLHFGGASTCTPAIYNNRLYIGISGGSAFGEDGASILVADINPETGAMSKAYLVPTGTDFSYCQSSGVIVNGYEKEDGFVYVYFLCNNAKGALYMVKDKPGITKPEPETGLLYTPTHEQYCIASAVVDSDGTIYIKNDSSWQFAIRRAETYLKTIEITGGNAVLDDGDGFVGSRADHYITVAEDTKNITLNLAANEGTEVRINGKTGDKQNVELTGDKTTVEVELIKGENTKVYTFTVYRGPVLAEMAIYGKPGVDKTLFALSQEFDEVKTEYTAKAKLKEPGDVYIKYRAVNAKDTVTCKAVSGVEYVQTHTSKPDTYFDVGLQNYGTMDKNKGVVDITVSGDCGSRTYRVTLYTNSELPLLTIGDGAVKDRTGDSAKVTVTAKAAGTLLYLVHDTSKDAPDAEQIESEGTGVDAIEGENTLTLDGLKCSSYTVYMILKDAEGAVSAVSSAEIPAGGHTEGAWKVTKAATCTEKGSKELHCSVCDAVIRTEEIPANGHKDGAWKVTKEATCTAKGAKELHCSVCDAVIKTEEIPVTGHKAGAWKVTREATCTAKGVKEQRCSVCNTVLKTEEIAATGHQFGAWVTTTPATALAEGVQTRTCAKCGAAETQRIARLAATGKLSITNFPLKVKQKYTVKVDGMAAGDYVVSWSTSNKKIATVSNTGKVTGKKKGKSTITATLASGLQIRTTVKVQKGTVKTKSITVNSKNITLNAKEKYQITAVIAPLTSKQKLTWSTSSKKIVKVDKKGRITARKKGKATITVKSGSKKVKIKVTVK